jgi:hypothetical protein
MYRRSRGQPKSEYPPYAHSADAACCFVGKRGLKVAPPKDLALYRHLMQQRGPWLGRKRHVHYVTSDILRLSGIYNQQAFPSTHSAQRKSRNLSIL